MFLMTFDYMNICRGIQFFKKSILKAGSFFKDAMQLRITVNISHIYRVKGEISISSSRRSNYELQCFAIECTLIYRLIKKI